MWADSGGITAVSPPGTEDRPHAGQHAGKVGGLLFQERAHMTARHRPGASERDDFGYLGEGEAQALRLPHECHKREHIGGIHAIASDRPAWHRQDAASLIEPECLSADAAPLRDFADQETVTTHTRRIDLDP